MVKESKGDKVAKESFENKQKLAKNQEKIYAEETLNNAKEEKADEIDKYKTAQEDDEELNDESNGREGLEIEYMKVLVTKTHKI